MRSNVWYCLMIIFCLYSCGQEQTSTNTSSAKESNNLGKISLKKIPSSQSNVSFSNDIKENKLVHYFNWNFIYSGAGVGIGDINNDGLQDIYLAGNMVSDKLYLNKGNFEFEDISKSAGIEDKMWSTGVNMVDVNADGLLDIYVCKNFFLLQESVRTNKLFINNGDLTFTESAEKYGLADAGFSVQASFFDAENDGDLDLYLVNQPMDEYSSKLARPETVAKLPYSDKFYINNNGKFEDKTKEMNFTNKVFGLNASVADFTNDGRTDIYLCNDYYHGDNFYINQGNNAFSDELVQRVDHTSFYSMGADVADINNDGWLDFITLDMAYPDHFRSKTNMESMRPQRFWQLVGAGNHYQYPVNNLQLNQGNGYFSEIGHLAGVSNTDWSWSPLFMDLDNDGAKDLVITNGLIHDLRNNDFINKMKSNRQIGPDEVSDYVKENAPSTPITNFVFQNNGKLQFENVTKSSGFTDKGFSSGMAYGDLDNDGNPDLVINNSNAEASIFQAKPPKNNHYINISLKGKVKNPAGFGANVQIFYDGKTELGTMTNIRGYMSSSQAILHFGIGKSTSIDSVVVQWDHVSRSVIKNPEIDQTITIEYQKTKANKPAKRNKNIAQSKDILNHKHNENAFDDYASQVLLPHKLSQNGPFLSKADVNNDGFMDLFIGSSNGATAELYIHQKDGGFKASKNTFLETKNKENLASVWFDIDQDGDQDLYIVNGGNEAKEGSESLQDLLYLNDGNGQLTLSNQDLSFTSFDGQMVKSLDIDKDKDMDLVIGGRLIADAYPKRTSSILLINDKGVLKEKTKEIIPAFKDIGLVTDIETVDLDGDADTDLLVIGEWMPISLLIQEEGVFTKKALDQSALSDRSWWWSAAHGDFDKDGDEDFIIGSLGLNNKFKPSEKKPFKVFSGDLDQNGDHDVVLAKTIDDQLFPVRGRECSTEEMPYVSEKFGDFESFANANLIQIIPQNQLDNSEQYTIKSFHSIYLENKGGLDFKAHILPIEAQMAPIKDIEVLDVNKDGHLDFIFAGNHFPSEVETVRYDAGKGGVMLGDGKGKFSFLSPDKSGIYIDCDARDLELVKLNDKQVLFTTCNNGPVLSFILE